MISDDGTSFVGAVTELQELVGQLDKDKIQETTAQKGVMWAFNLQELLIMVDHMR